MTEHAGPDPLSAAERERWRRLEALLDAALDLPAHQRHRFLSDACVDDALLLAEAKRVLAAGEESGDFLRQPVAALATPAIAERLEAGLPYGRVGPYRLLRPIGHGGMGVVYLAERDDEHFRQRVALKLLRQGLELNDRAVQRFVEERQILASLQHPHIARLYDGGLTADGLPWFAMEYVEGEAIDQYCDSRRLTVEERLLLFGDACDAVEHAHRQSIVHRDLKPSNIFVSGDGQVRLLDFGIAKLLAAGESGRTPALTRTGERLLTPEYASPEQVRSDPVTASADVYSLGVVLYELLTGLRPFRARGRTPHELEQSILEQEPIRPSTAVIEGAADPESGTSPAGIAGARQTVPDRLQRRLRGDLDSIVLMALRKEPDRRYASVALLAADIRRHLDGQPVAARASDRAYRVRRFVARHRATLRASALGVAVGVAVIAAVNGRSRLTSERRATVASPPVLALGRLVDHRATTDSTALSALVDMLATNLARARGLHVVSAVRMAELVRQVGGGGDPPSEAYVVAARMAGATELLEGAVYAEPSGRFRLDLRRVDLSDSRIVGAQQATGVDFFALADSATAGLVAQLGAWAPSGSVADVTTRSLAAYRLYTLGLQHFIRPDRMEALSLFDAALAEDSTFAMAAYYGARSIGYDWRSPSMTREARAAFEQRVGRALRLADRASDRERLIIRAWWARNFFAPELRQLAETLAVRYPQEVEGHLDLGLSLLQSGRAFEGIPHLERVVALDSLALRASATGCSACEAIRWIVDGSALVDSLDAAERAGRRWLRLQPKSALAHWRLADVLDQRGSFEEAESVLTMGVALAVNGEELGPLVKHWLRAGSIDRADSVVRARREASAPNAGGAIPLYQTLVLRHQGRLADALITARTLRAASREQSRGDAAPYSAIPHAQVLFEMGRYREAAALFDSIARWRPSGQPSSVAAMNRGLALSQMATARLALGDTARLEALAADVERVGAGTSLARSRVQHHYVRGLLLTARGLDAQATDAFQAALSVSKSDDGRTNYELAKVLLRRGKPREAIAILKHGVRGAMLETANYRVTLTEAHELLASAWEAAGQPDSAARHLRYVADAWRTADPPFASRGAAARRRLGGSGR